MTVEHLDGERYVIGIRGHRITVDQPLADGGTDTALTPSELLVSSLASCLAFHNRCTVHNTLYQIPDIDITII